MQQPQRSALHRRSDWLPRLDRLVQERLQMPFAWGGNDCGSFAADVVLTMTDTDLADFRAPRRNGWQTMRQLLRHGGVASILARAGLPPVPVHLAQRGDLVMIKQGLWPVLAVCIGEVAMAPAAEGLASASMEEALEAWSV